MIAAAGAVVAVGAARAALPLVECLWVRRDRAGLVAGLIASAAVLPLQAGLGAMLASAPLLASAWHWLVPAAYLMTVARARRGHSSPSANGRRPLAGRRASRI